MEIEVFKGRFFRVTVEGLGLGLLYERVYQRNGITIFPVTADGNIRLIRLATTENPTPRIRPVTGYIEDNEAPLDCAKRELAEELGLEAEEWTLFATANGESIKKNQYFFVARGLRPFKGLIHKDPHENTEPVDFTREELAAKTLAEEFGTGENAFALLKFVLDK